MLCISLKEFSRPCGPTSGGVSNVVTFDPDDMNFTQPSAIAGVRQPYSVIALRNGSTGNMYKIDFTREEAEWTWKQSVKGCSVKYEQTFNFQLPENSQNLTTWMEAVDAAACCCGIGMIIRLNNGRIFVAGEKWVNGAEIPRFTIINNGSSGTSGKLFDDFNGGNLVLVGAYSRNLYEYTGQWSTIVALMSVSHPTLSTTIDRSANASTSGSGVTVNSTATAGTSFKFNATDVDGSGSSATMNVMIAGVQKAQVVYTDEANGKPCAWVAAGVTYYGVFGSGNVTFA